MQAFKYASGSESSRLNWRDAHFFAIALNSVELNNAVSCCKKSKIPTAAHVCSREDGSTNLTNDDAACCDNLSVVNFDASILRIRVATVSGTTARFLVCHEFVPYTWFAFRRFTSTGRKMLSLDLGDLKYGNRLTVSVTALVVLTALILEHHDLLAKTVAFDLCFD